MFPSHCIWCCVTLISMKQLGWLFNKGNWQLYLRASGSRMSLFLMMNGVVITPLDHLPGVARANFKWLGQWWPCGHKALARGRVWKQMHKTPNFSWKAVGPKPDQPDRPSRPCLQRVPQDSEIIQRMQLTVEPPNHVELKKESVLIREVSWFQES